MGDDPESMAPTDTEVAEEILQVADAGKKQDLTSSGDDLYGSCISLLSSQGSETAKEMPGGTAVTEEVMPIAEAIEEQELDNSGNDSEPIPPVESKEVAEEISQVAETGEKQDVSTSSDDLESFKSLPSGEGAELEREILQVSESGEINPAWTIPNDDLESLPPMECTEMKGIREGTEETPRVVETGLTQNLTTMGNDPESMPPTDTVVAEEILQVADAGEKQDLNTSDFYESCSSLLSLEGTEAEREILEGTAVTGATRPVAETVEDQELDNAGNDPEPTSPVESKEVAEEIPQVVGTGEKQDLSTSCGDLESFKSLPSEEGAELEREVLQVSMSGEINPAWTVSSDDLESLPPMEWTEMEGTEEIPQVVLETDEKQNPEKLGPDGECTIQ
jgi:hypothetical protein